VTEAQITLLRSFAETDVVTFMADGNTAAALALFEATVASLDEMQKAGWLELEVAEERKTGARSPPPEGEGRSGLLH
jgi:hypothetical protein